MYECAREEYFILCVLLTPYLTLKNELIFKFIIGEKRRSVLIPNKKKLCGVCAKLEKKN